MKEGIYNRVLAKMLTRIENVSTRMAKEFKGTRPFDQEAVDNRQRLYDYSQLTPEKIQFARQNFGNEVVDNHILEMEQLKARYKNA